MDTKKQESDRIATFKIPVTDYREVEKVARDEDRTVSYILRLAVRRYLEEQAA